MMWVEMASALVRGQIHSLLSGIESEKVTGVSEELMPLALLLDECRDLLQFREAEHAAEYKEMQHAHETLRSQLAARERASELESKSGDEEIILQHERFNYALALEAIAVLQGDPDETCVEEAAPSHLSGLADEKSADDRRLGTFFTFEALEREKQQIVQEAEIKYGKLLALQKEQFAYAQQEQADKHGKSLEMLSCKHADEIQALKTMHGEFVDSLRHESADELAREQAQHLKEQDALRCASADALERLRAEHQQELQAAKSTYDTDIEKKSLESRLMLDTQTTEHKALQRELAAKLTASENSNSKLSAELKVYATYTQSIWTSIDSLLASVHENEILLDSVRSRFDAYQVFGAEVLQNNATLEHSVAKHLSHIKHLEDTITDLQAQLTEHKSTLTNLHDTERRLSELQRELEQTHDVQANVDALQQRAEHAETKLTYLREQVRELDELRVKVAQLQSEAEELQTVVSMHRASAQNIEQERVQASDQIQKLYVTKPCLPSSSAKLYVMEHTLHERDEEVSSLRSARTRHIDQIRTLRNTEKALRAGNDSSEWQEKISQLEMELTAKAQEVEEADTRILTALRDNKRLISQNRLLQSKIAQMKQGPDLERKSEPPKPVLHDRTNCISSKNEQHSNLSPVKSPVKTGRGDAQFRDRLARFKPS